ncbi:bifunctional 2-polyprenyl-6-hydroxyphenol methylase/3-demethylubiquinol 3-O-methyltransferase UbiG [Anaeroselena agilis]|uniref:Bifunctional 2-polyprenyl-6-hydroxyphenol methylase/3-demethylubiquinol 3-O-methyltransferase UbiG n=1 Tax=Anaeroselena agilis TaxID=3063788 RepID=A0ABU3P3C3_9FIRM|nr:bifunctional 2-polyprenyl-6-hydroxyphenol methylase/3-demethylubiquinol 3-O-methyltransferase UbiG [Selenomonadales bacterium 4137-cl]
MPVNNGLYETRGDRWWREDAGFEFASLRYCLNPVRYGFFRRKVQEGGLSGRKVLDIGCGGGFLAEEFARDGFAVTGIDPASASVAAAREHAAANSVLIDYRVGRGEELPFAEESFDIVTCCDVLEHVEDAGRVISEAARTLRSGGFFFFETVNRTLASKLVMIKFWQEWSGLCPENAHVWEKFITPAELAALMEKNNLAAREVRGLTSRRKSAILWKLPAIKSGRLGGRELAEVFALAEGDDVSVSYMGYAIKSK